MTIECHRKITPLAVHRQKTDRMMTSEVRL